MSPVARISKHHGLGNDFLVWKNGDVTRHWRCVGVIAIAVSAPTA